MRESTHLQGVACQDADEKTLFLHRDVLGWLQKDHTIAMSTRAVLNQRLDMPNQSGGWTNLTKEKSLAH